MNLFPLHSCCSWKDSRRSNAPLCFSGRSSITSIQKLLRSSTRARPIAVRSFGGRGNISRTQEPDLMPRVSGEMSCYENLAKRHRRATSKGLSPCSPARQFSTLTAVAKRQHYLNRSTEARISPEAYLRACEDSCPRTWYAVLS